MDDEQRCVYCGRRIKRVGLLWRDWYGQRACAYRFAGLGLHKLKRGPWRPYGQTAR